MSNTNSFKIYHLPRLVIKTFNNWLDSEPFKLSAIVAYYAILSLPALIVIILNVVGNIYGRDIVQGELLDEISKAVGKSAANTIQQMMMDRGNESVSLFTTIVGISTLVYGATGVFFQLQEAFDKIWKFGQNETIGFGKIIFYRIKGFGFILIIGFLMLISFIITTVLSFFSKRIDTFLPETWFKLVYVVDVAMSLIFIYALFAAMFKYLPTKTVKWKAVRVGAAITAILFVIGKYLIALYFNTMDPASTYGAAGSIILVMLWVSYSSLIVFFGANFTKVYADFYLNN